MKKTEIMEERKAIKKTIRESTNMTASALKNT